MSPKKLLRFKDACSNIEEFDEGLRFRRIIQDQNKDLVGAEKVRKILLCSGEVYYELDSHRNKIKKNDVAIVRVEQFCPFPFGMLKDEIAKFKNAQVMWVQEEHKNAGGWAYVTPRINNILQNIGRKDSVSYAGRNYSAATATGYHKQHEAELQAFLEEAFAWQTSY